MQSTTFLDGRVMLHCGDCLDVLARMPENSVDSVVTDPPYHLTSIVKRFGNSNPADVEKNAAGRKIAGQGTSPHGRAAAGFMGKQWDGGDIAFQPATWAAVLRVLKPGGYLLAFSATRSYHRMGVAIEDAGFEIRDQIGWCYASGFPKSLNVSRKLDGTRCSCARPERPDPLLQHDLRCVRSADVSSPEPVRKERPEVLFQGVPEHGLHGAMLRAESEEGGQGCEEQSLEGRRHASQEARELRFGEVCPLPGSPAFNGEDGRLCDGTPEGDGRMDRPAVDPDRMRPPRRSQAAEQSASELGTVAGQPKPQDGGAWPHCGRCGKPIVPDGLGTALKPAWEPICVARKPLSESSVAANVLKWGTGALNIDGCRVEAADQESLAANWDRAKHTDIRGGKYIGGTAQGIKLNSKPGDGRWPANIVHDGSDEVLAGFPTSESTIGKPRGAASGAGWGMTQTGAEYDDAGSAARFFYSSKADAEDRIGSKHPTVKPLDLMQYLCRLITPPGGTVLDLFAGTGTTGEAAWREGFKAILIEREAEYQADIARRMDLAVKPAKRAAVAKTKNNLMGAEGTPLFGGEAA